MLAHAIFFYFFSFVAIISAIMVTASKNTVHSVFFLILDFISISCLFIMIGAEFLGMIMLIVYVGAVAVLFLFVVMMLNVAQQKNQWFKSSETSTHIPVGLIVSLIIFFELIIVIGGWKYKPDVIKNFSDNLEYLRELSKYKYNLCPEGNFFESHRIWESLIFGCTPIVEKNTVNENFFNIGIPLIILESFNELTSISYEELEHKNKVNEGKDYSKFSNLEYWKEIIDKKI